MKEKSTLSYRLTRCFVFILVVGVPFVINAEPTEEWVARYNGPGNGLDIPYAIAMDPSGNVYVTGESKGSGTYADYATVKYDSEGNELWIARYNGPGNDPDFANAIAVDALGNVYVTGESWGSGTSGDYATVKYDTDGNQLWVARYNGPGNGLDIAYAIAVDPSGNIYVTGQSWGSETGSDYATVKYNAGGKELWVKRYDGPGIDPDFANAIAVDAVGNVYVTGVSEGSETDADYATLKYDTNGNQLWIARYNGVGNIDDGARAIAVDPSGNVYVTGDSEGNYATVKYDTDGNQLWEARYNGLGNGLDNACAMAIDSSGNIYVTGQSWGSGTDSDYATVKYNSDGNQLWVQRYNGPGSYGDFAYAIALDSSGNVYVTGQSWGSGTDADYATVKYDTNGNELWEARYNGPGNGSDNPYAIALDPSGSVYVTGQSEGDYATVKYREVDEVEVTMELPAGWSMISLPVKPADAAVTTLFPEAVVVYKYQKGMGYVRVAEDEELKIGIGYWIVLDNPQSYVMRGAVITEYTIPVQDGWYMIGGCTYPAGKIVTSGKIVVIHQYMQDPGYTRLLELELLAPGKGYWILLSDTTQGAAFTASTFIEK